MRNESSPADLHSPLPSLLTYNNYTAPEPTPALPPQKCYHCLKFKEVLRCGECKRVVCRECLRQCGECSQMLCAGHLNYDYEKEQECCSSCAQ